MLASAHRRRMSPTVKETTQMPEQMSPYGNAQSKEQTPMMRAFLEQREAMSVVEVSWGLVAARLEGSVVCPEVAQPTTPTSGRRHSETLSKGGSVFVQLLTEMTERLYRLRDAVEHVAGRLEV